MVIIEGAKGKRCYNRMKTSKGMWGVGGIRLEDGISYGMEGTKKGQAMRGVGGGG